MHVTTPSLPVEYFAYRCSNSSSKGARLLAQQETSNCIPSPPLSTTMSASVKAPFCLHGSSLINVSKQEDDLHVHVHTCTQAVMELW